ncbi:PREDICTED: kunitz-type serine protease inhibitor A-like [Papilio xuthus]|uniref:Kunitz-type serine protease inhibitor A-like n=1 Tax=Papilio xuthus TaxID=66420 RepID=A0AAJ6YZ95_PAPXU|nr:PREDICTED: kunitz-type serine protease inhibitor A-like [Papilio xuthus]XP_013161935.1 PREDICTED: kunitz-type serine protease inhibitor A-like [Papilio xuthus]
MEILNEWLKYVLLLIVLNVHYYRCTKSKEFRAIRTTKYRVFSGPTRSICMQIDNTLKARHKSCFLRPDTGPCRADLIQWYYDVKQSRCFRFFWGGCQGNGNRFETHEDCKDYCKLNLTEHTANIPFFCSVLFDYGTCFGHYFRWGWDKLTKTCKRYLYSGCGGNQNNFQTRDECFKTCLIPPSNSLKEMRTFTTCIPVNYIPARFPTF